MKKIIVIVACVVIIAVVVFFVTRKHETSTGYTFAEVTRGNLENMVSATGTLEPVTSIEVGTQVSGIIDKIYVDFNSHVRKNQLLAVLDTTLLSVQVRDARASVLRAQAQYDKAKYDFDRTEKLFQQSLISETEYVAAKSECQSALASLQSSKIAQERADRNMYYAFVRSPIDGTVISRKIEEGQTVASSFQTPMLFLIAEDLSKMEIHAQVDESDIGLIKEGMPVRFEVQAYDDKVFNGKVRQVWLEPEAVSNVVNYTVVIDAENPDELLLPGMTTNIDFIVEEKKDVLMVPNAVVKLQPTQEMFSAMRKRFEERFHSRQDSTRQGSQEQSGGPRQGGMPGGGFFAGGATGFPQMSGSGAHNPFANTAMLWYLDEKGNLQFQPVHTGMTDGKSTEITPIRGEVKEGMKVISAIQGQSSTNGQRTNGTTQRSVFGGPGFGPPPR
jgi:HlyD family secretion protein